jgi:hypothetical protein
MALNKTYGHSQGRAYIAYAQVGRACVPFAAFHLREQVEAALEGKSSFASYVDATVHTSYMGERTANILTVTDVAADADEFVCTLIGNDWDLSHVDASGAIEIPVGRMPSKDEMQNILSVVYDGQTDPEFFDFSKNWVAEKF